MGAIIVIAAATLCVYLLRSVWRMLVEVPDADQMWTPDRWSTRPAIASLNGFRVSIDPA